MASHKKALQEGRDPKKTHAEALEKIATSDRSVVKKDVPSKPQQVSSAQAASTTELAEDDIDQV